MNTYTVEIKHLYKDFDLGFNKNIRTLKEKLDYILHKPFHWQGKNEYLSDAKNNFHALTNINLSIRTGETVGIIGPNGSGKSTLLQILAGIISPTQGEVSIRGKIGSLLEVGAGFNSELTGKENVFLSGAILGIRRNIIQQKFNEIVEFSGIGPFINIPVKKYSSGMYVRLAFAITVQLNTDILLIDEVLSVGDAQFQQKSFKKMEEISHSNQRTIVIVSHNLDMMQKLCDRVCYLKEGRIQDLGGAADTINSYIASVDAKMHINSTVQPIRGSMHILFSKKTDISDNEDTAVFFQSEAKTINEVRLKHLDSLNLPLKNKKILDVGSGVGILANYLYKKSPHITCIDGRKKNIDFLKRYAPHIKNSSFVVNVDTDDLTPLGIFDVVFCYGLLYHVNKPEQVLEKLSHQCKQILLLESCVTDYPEPLNLWVEETSAYNQALNGIGSRPTPSFIISSLHQNGFPYVYFPKKVPGHPDFNFSYEGTFRHTNHRLLLRQIFIASKIPLANSRLILVSYSCDKLDTQKMSDYGFIKNNKNNKLLQLAGEIYKPLPLLPTPGWVLGSFEKNLTRQIFKKIWEELCKRFVKKQAEFQIGWHQNLKFILKTNDEISRSLFIEGCYEPNQIYFITKFLKPGMIFIDVGANFGFYSLIGASLVGNKGKVLAVEPSSREYSRLIKNIKLNHLNQIQSLKLGILDKSYKEKIFKIASNNHAGHNTLGKFAYPEVKQSKTEKIEIKSLDNIIKQYKIRSVDLIKMDIEGSEFSALIGAYDTLKNYQPVIIFELFDKALQGQSSNSRQIWKYLQKFNYDIYGFDKTSGLPEKSKKLKFYAGENMLAIPRSKINLLDLLWQNQ